MKVQCSMDLEGKRERNGRHVASVYFATRGMNLGPEDQFMLKMLAAEYANTAKKNRGLKGTVTGHADIRPSTNPDNATLAGNRAFYTARSLKKCLAQATQIEVGRFEFIAKGEEDRACRGDQRCITAGDPQALANYRRADVHILTPYAKPIPFRPPDLDHIRFPRVDSDLVPRILKEDKRAMKDMVIVAIGDVEGLGQYRILALQGMGFPSRKPPWWDQRERTVPRAVGAPPLVKKALLLYRDYREFFYWDDLLWGEGGSVKRWSESKTEQIGRRDASLTSKVSEQAGYYLFIARWLQVAGRDLHKGCE